MQTLFRIFFTTKLFKMKKFFTSVFLFVCFFANAQTDTLELDEITINSWRIPTTYSESSRVVSVISKADIASTPVLSLADLLENALNVDIRQRGTFGPQADISIRGGTFDQTLVLLNGIKINDPQTGHHNMNIPVDLSSIERIEILEGPGSRIFGPNAFSGAVNIITNTKAEKRLKTDISAGDFGLKTASADLAYNFGFLQNTVSVSKNISDGFVQNTDFDITNVFFQSQARSSVGNFNLQLGFLDKNFGANSFYTPSFPFQYEKTKTKLAALTYEKKAKTNIKANIYWRRHFDRFELLREGADYYTNTGEAWINPFVGDTISWYKGHNYHQTEVVGADVNIAFSSFLGKSAFGVELRSEHIYSNKLGVSMSNSISIDGENAFYTKAKGRENMSAFVEHSWLSEKIAISGGLLMNYSSDFAWNLYSGIDAAYKPHENIRLFLSLNQSMRVPTFTDLYYQGPRNIGNPKLKPEKASSFELGLKYQSQIIHSHISAFYRKGKDMIAWVKLNDEDPWQSQNLTETNTLGFEASLLVKMNRLLNNFPMKKLRFSYAWLELEKKSGEYKSNYVLENLKHKFTASADIQIYKGLACSLSYNFQQREGKYQKYFRETKKYGNWVAYKPVSLFDGRIYYAKNWFTLYLETKNIFDFDYYDFGNIQMPGRWTRVGVKLNVNLNRNKK